METDEAMDSGAVDAEADGSGREDMSGDEDGWDDDDEAATAAAN